MLTMQNRFYMSVYPVLMRKSANKQKRRAKIYLNEDGLII